MRHTWAILMVLVSAVVVTSVNMAYTAHEQQVSDRKWCALFTTLDSPQAPATTERGLIIQRQIHTLRVQLECRP